jgi:hypothetical protein
MSTFINKKVAKVAKSFHCDLCDYVCFKKSNYDKHILTDKHKNQHLSTFINQKVAKVASSVKAFECVCGKLYKERSGLWRHKQKCELTSVKTDITNNNNVDIVCELMKQNKDLKDMLIEQNNKILEIAKEGKNITNNTMNNFNLNIFLNEKCKDAVNILDFINSLQVQLKDLEETGRIGYVNGITKIFIKGLQELDICKRPIHCSDLKRETLYIKDQNTWEKDSEKSKLKNAIRILSNKNAQQVYKWGQENPEYKDTDSKKNDEYMKLIHITMGGSTCEEENKNLEKIAKNVVKEVLIDKDEK